jgi:hypothetical protein
VAEFLIPRTVPKFAGAPLTALGPDDLRYILRPAATACSPPPWNANFAAVFPGSGPAVPRFTGHERPSTYQPLFRRSRWRQRAIRPPAVRSAGRVPWPVAFIAPVGYTKI